MKVRDLVERLAMLLQDHDVWVESGDYAASFGYLAVSEPGAHWDEYEVEHGGRRVTRRGPRWWWSRRRRADWAAREQHYEHLSRLHEQQTDAWIEALQAGDIDAAAALQAAATRTYRAMLWAP